MTAMSALCQIATWQLDRDRSSYRPRSTGLVKETGFRLLVFRWVPLLPSLLGAVPRPWPQNAANRGSGPRRNPFLFPI